MNKISPKCFITPNIIVKEFLFELHSILIEKLKIAFRGNDDARTSPIRQLTISWTPSRGSSKLSLDDYSNKYINENVYNLAMAIDWEIFKIKRTYYYPDTTLDTFRLPLTNNATSMTFDGLSIRLLNAFDIVWAEEIYRIDVAFKIRDEQ